MSGLIINLEGSGCAGKTTAITRIADNLKEMGYEPIVITNHVIDDYTAALRETLSKFGADVSELSKACVYAAIWRHIQTMVIEPARANNQIVLLDRWCATTFFYQAPAGKMRLLDMFSNIDLVPTDVCLHLQCTDMSVIEQRLANRHERNDRYNNEFIRNSLVHMPNYIYGCKLYTREYHSLDTSLLDIDTVVNACMRNIIPHLPELSHVEQRSEAQTSESDHGGCPRSADGDWTQRRFTQTL